MNEMVHQAESSADVENNSHENGQRQEKKTLLEERKGLNLLVTSAFMLGEMAGVGVLALPRATEITGWVGLILLGIFGLICAYTGKLLGDCWLIVRERYPAMRGHERHPYPAVGMITFGNPARILVSISINSALFCGGVVYLIICAQNFYSLVQQNQGQHIAVCYWILIALAIIWPLTLPGTPKDIKCLAIAAVAATVGALVLLFVAMVLDSRNQEGPVVHESITPLNFANGFGIIVFGLCGHPTFLTFQMDMKEPRRFGTACKLAYSAMLLMYMPTAAIGYFVYGNKLKENILITVGSSKILQVVQSLFTAHVITGFVILLNTLFQEAEELLSIPTRFTYKRVLLRTGLCLLAALIAETIPRFGLIQSFIGGSSMSLLTFIFPPIFYLKLTTMEGSWEKVHVPWWKVIFLMALVVVGTVAGSATTYAAVMDLCTSNAFTVPCFINNTGGIV